MQRSERRKRTRLVAVRMTPDEWAKINDAAKDAGISVGRFMRQAALKSDPFDHYWTGLTSGERGSEMRAMTQYADEADAG